MTTYKNTSEQRRVWPRIQHGNGTLELDPGEVVDLPEVVEDVHLKLTDEQVAGPSEPENDDDEFTCECGQLDGTCDECEDDEPAADDAASTDD